MTNHKIELFERYEYRIMHLENTLEELEQRIMNIRKGHQILLRVVKFQMTQRRVVVTASRYPNRLYQDLRHLRTLLNSERYQLYYSYYQTGKTLEAKIKHIEERQCVRRETPKRLGCFKTKLLRTVRTSTKKKRSFGRDDLAKLKKAYTDVQDVMEYLETGRPPRPKRDLSRRSRLQQEVFFSRVPNWKLERILVSKETIAPPNIKSILTRYLGQMTEREREAFITPLGQGLSAHEVVYLMTRSILAHYLGQLTKREREAYVLHHGQGLPTKEVARIMRCKTGTVDQLLFRAHRTIEITRQKGAPPPTLF